MKRRDLPPGYGGSAYQSPSGKKNAVLKERTPSAQGAPHSGRSGVGMSPLTRQWMSGGDFAPSAAQAPWDFPISGQENRPKRPVTMPKAQRRDNAVSGANAKEEKPLPLEVERLLARLGVDKIGQEELLLGTLLLLLANAGADLTTLSVLGILIAM